MTASFNDSTFVKDNLDLWTAGQNKNKRERSSLEESQLKVEDMAMFGEFNSRQQSYAFWLMKEERVVSNLAMHIGDFTLNFIL